MQQLNTKEQAEAGRNYRLGLPVWKICSIYHRFNHVFSALFITRVNLLASDEAFCSELLDTQRFLCCSSFSFIGWNLFFYVAAMLCWMGHQGEELWHSLLTLHSSKWPMGCSVQEEKTGRFVHSHQHRVSNTASPFHSGRRERRREGRASAATCTSSWSLSST